MSMGLTGTELIDAVRNQIDEDATNDITDPHILAALNRGLVTGLQAMLKIFPDPLLAEPLEVTSTVLGEIDMPTDVFEDRVIHIDQTFSGVAHRIEPGTPSEFYEHDLGTGSSASLASIWAQVGRKIKFKPEVRVGSQFDVWYMKKPDKIVKPQGRITRVGADYVVVDSYGDGLSTDSDELNSFFSVIDFNTGRVKWTGQVKNIVGDKISHKSTATRSTVLNKTVQTSFPADSDAPAVDDFICEAAGTCIPYMPVILQNYVISYAIVEMYDRLGYDSTFVRGSMDRHMKILEKQWAGRPARTKIHLTSGQWKKGRTWGRTRR